MRKRILVDGRTPINYTMFEPVYRALKNDPRVSVYFTASEEPRLARHIFRSAGPDARIIAPWRAAFMKFDAYVTSDFMWTPLPRGTRRVQMFHGVGGKYGFDAPTQSLAPWHRLFFVNQRRLRNCIAAGALESTSPAIRLVGMPKVDCLVDGSIDHATVMGSLGLPRTRPTVLYAPTWSPASSLNKLGEALLGRLAAMPVNVIVKLHDRSRDLRACYSGGVDWPARLTPLLRRAGIVLAPDADICPYLVAADILITDHSSCGFEYLLLDRPLVRIHVPELLALAQVHADYVRLMSDVADSADDVPEIVAAVERALANPKERSGRRREVAADLFHQPGSATARCVSELYDAIELEPLRSEARRGASHQPVAPVVQLE